MVVSDQLSQPAGKHRRSEEARKGNAGHTQQDRPEHRRHSTHREHERHRQPAAKRPPSPEELAGNGRSVSGAENQREGHRQDRHFKNERYQRVSGHGSQQMEESQQRHLREEQIQQRRQSDRSVKGPHHLSQTQPAPISLAKSTPKIHAKVEPLAAPKTRLSFSDELSDDSEAEGARTFSLSASTAHRFQTERGILQINPMLSDHVPTFSMPRDVAAPGPAASSSSLGRICFGVAQSRGLRPYMEDRCVVVASYQPLSGSHTPVTDGVPRSFAAVVDGHNGCQAADHVTDRLHKVLAHAPALRSFAGEAAVTDAEQLGMSQAFTQAFATVDAEILDAARQQPNSDGATCVALLRVGSTLWTAHVGDSRAVMSRDGAALRLTEDHKPAPGGPEHERVKRSGGSVEFQHCWRVICPPQGERPASGLAVSRALGDIHFKEPQRLVESRPEVSHFALSPADTFVVVASDGLWDVLGDQQAVGIAQAVLDTGMRSDGGGLRATDALANAAATALLSEALAKQSQDNITVLLLLLQWD